MIMYARLNKSYLSHNYLDVIAATPIIPLLIEAEIWGTVCWGPRTIKLFWLSLYLSVIWRNLCFSFPITILLAKKCLVSAMSPADTGTAKVIAYCKVSTKHLSYKSSRMSKRLPEKGTSPGLVEEQVNLRLL